MMELEVDGRRIVLLDGEQAIGSAPDCAIVLDAAGLRPRHALVTASRGAAAIRPASPDALVLVNGIRLGPEPMPLLHGDKVRLGTAELTVADTSRAGRTTLQPAVSLPPPAGATPPSPRGARGPTRHGRLVSLRDGREYPIGPRGLVVGREAGCDIVVDEEAVSRRHATIDLTEDGYRLADTSANGTFVNDARVEGTVVLRRGDVVRVAGAEFRFHGDEAADTVESPPPGAAQRLADTLHGMPGPAEGAASRLADTMHGLPALPRPPAGPVLASFLVRSGQLKGQRLPLRVPLATLGRAGHNDIVLPDASVSGTHARVQRRDDVWIVSDLESTNGSYVDGLPVAGEVPLSTGATLRLGDVALLFEAAEGPVAAGEAEGTALLPKVRAARPARPSVPPPVPAADQRRGRAWLLLVLLAAVAAAAIAILNY